MEAEQLEEFVEYLRLALSRVDGLHKIRAVTLRKPSHPDVLLLERWKQITDENGGRKGWELVVRQPVDFDGDAVSDLAWDEQWLTFWTDKGWGTRVGGRWRVEASAKNLGEEAELLEGRKIFEEDMTWP